MNNIHIKDSYKIWLPDAMEEAIWQEYYNLNGSVGSPSLWLNRTYESMYVEWWLHNIGYYLTLPFCEYDFIRRLNLRFKDVDLNEHGK
jgi:hypothetical protein